MCHEAPASIVPRIVALLLGESVAWTGNEILGRVSSGDVPCEAHFDETIRLMVREGKLTSDQDAFAPTLTSTTRCRLAFMLSPETRTASSIRLALAAEAPKPRTVVATPLPPAAPALPSPAARLEMIGRLREERARVEREWFERFGADCFRNGPAGFVKTLFLQARTTGMMPRLRDAVERAQGRTVDDFERHCENLLQLNERDGTIPVVTIDSGVKLDLMHYISIDLERAERDVREGREGNPSNARELLGFLKEVFDKPSLRGAPLEKAAPPGDPMLGRTFGPYKIVAVIGRGGMGAVYEGLDETLDRRVAVKVLHSQFTDNREYQERFLREVRNAVNAKLEHPNITQVYAAGREGPHLWLAMQLIRGRTLARVIEERKKLPPDEALRIVRQVADGLTAAHAAQMVHRDIKPDNVMIEDSGRVRIMDFGLMRSVDAKKDGLTADGLFVGTVEYASPEQCRDKPLDARTDLYSLGVVLYELLSGRRPYQAKNAFGYLSMIPDPDQPPVPLRRHEPSIPAAVEALVHRLISKNRDERFGSAQDLVRAIDGLGAAAAVVPPSAKSAVASLVAWTIALAAAVVATILLWPSSSDGEALDAFDRTIPKELVNAAAWLTWEADTRDGPGGSVGFDPAKNAYVLTAPAKEQVRLLKKLKGAERGYRIRWAFGAGAADGAAFMVAISFSRWFEIGPISVTLFRADQEKVSVDRKVELPGRFSGGTLHVIPCEGQVRIILDGRLLFSLPEADDALVSGLQLGMSGGTLVLESIRVAD